MTYPICDLCKVKLGNIEQYRFKFPQCKNDYFLYNEIIEYEYNIGTVHDDNASTIETAELAANIALDVLRLEIQGIVDVIRYNQAKSLGVKRPELTGNPIFWPEHMRTD